eukprot:TRINITY_DN7684_c0_g1_i4.p2 TRINITY_DN7684_c0_g1~~TRINITY_DN7684_c0_g1_i4.p2  ORF type:complete len:107 (+),score=21.64 TRINITY_DN7684_c0_g1_i4:169-489(+)
MDAALLWKPAPKRLSSFALKRIQSSNQCDWTDVAAGETETKRRIQPLPLLQSIQSEKGAFTESVQAGPRETEIERRIQPLPLLQPVQAGRGSFVESLQAGPSETEI